MLVGETRPSCPKALESTSVAASLARTLNLLYPPLLPSLPHKNGLSRPESCERSVDVPGCPEALPLQQAGVVWA